MIEILFILLLANDLPIVTCTYDAKKVAAICPKGHYPIDWDNPVYEEWLWQPATRAGEIDYNGPLSKVKPRHGAELKIGLGDDGRWYALASCEARKKRRMDDAQDEGDRVANQTLPDDCQPWYKKVK